MVRGVHAETAAGERIPDRALVRARVAVHVRLDPRVARGRERRVARLEAERIDKEMQPNDVTLIPVWVRARRRRPALRGDKACVDLV